jgi:hypothetical protein
LSVDLVAGVEGEVAVGGDDEVVEDADVCEARRKNDLVGDAPVDGEGWPGL